MTRFPLVATLASVTLTLADPARAQMDLTWYTIDGGGGTSSGGAFTLIATIGQPDAGKMTGGTFEVRGGFWTAGGAPPPCYANCDGSTTPPILNVQDFTCFLNRFASGETYANCDGSTVQPILNVQDFTCFLNRFATGCP